MRHRLSFFIHVHRSGRASVVARLTSPAFRKVDCSVGPLVGDWDRDRQRAKATSREAANLNLRLAEIERGVEAFFTRADLDGRQPAREEAARALRELCGGAETSTRVTLQEALKRRLKAASNEWSGGTYGKYRALARHLADHSPAATCDEVDDGWVDDFAAHLIRAGVTNTTALKYCKSLLALLRWASSDGLCQPAALRLPRLRGNADANGPIYLTIDELKRVEAADLDGTAAQVRDVFVFCCYTGLRFSDAAKLRHEDDKGDYIEVFTVKTSEALRIELNRHARAILDRWRKLEGRALPAISNAKSNLYLKRIARACRITQPVRRVTFRGSRRVEEVVAKCNLVSTHTARRTFVVTALTLGVPAEVVMRWTGHADWSSMRPYVAIVDELKKKEMGKFDGI